MFDENHKVLFFTFLFSFMLYMSFKPWEFTDFVLHIIMFLMALIFPLLVAINYIKGNKKAFWISVSFFFIGLLPLYRGFYLNGQFYLLDYLFYRNVETSIEMGDRAMYGTPNSFWLIESILLYSLLCILGLIVGYVVEMKKDTK